jgi:peptidoglycan/xylan/chitin deacetylase (PgdA/CDA1 family)
VVAWLAGGAEGPARAAITVDDGYPDTYAVVLPELARRGLPATLFLATGPPETGEPAWIDRVRWIVKQTRAAVVDLPGSGLPRLPLLDQPTRLASLARLLGHMKTLGAAEVEQLADRLAQSLDPRGEPPGVLGWDEVRRLAAGPVRLGGHTHRHYMLSRLGEREQRDEIETGLRLIRERTGAPVTSFAYPNGEAADYDARTIDVLRDLGIRSAVTCRNALALPGHDLFQLPRLYTSEPSLPVFAARLAGLGREQRAAVEVA